MIQPPTEADIGRMVTYTPRHGPSEEGRISSLAKTGDVYCFVRYADDASRHGKLTPLDRLEYANEA